MLVGVLLANAAVVPPVREAAAQSGAKPAATVAAQDPSQQPWPPEGVLRPGQGLKAPALIHEEKPRYTADAMRLRIEGLVEVEAIILTDGTVGPVRVVRSLDRENGLDAEAVKAVKQWTFRPGEKDGKAVPVLVNIELTFKVRDRR
jgi:TonB family protein